MVFKLNKIFFVLTLFLSLCISSQSISAEKQIKQKLPPAAANQQNIFIPMAPLNEDITLIDDYKREGVVRSCQ